MPPPRTWTVRAPVIAAVALAVVTTACGTSSNGVQPQAETTTSAAPTSAATEAPDTGASQAFLAAACAGDTEATTTGELPPDLNEVSGLVASRQHEGVFWVVEDSLEPPDLVAIDETGTVLGTVVLEGEGVLNVDWEDLTIAPGPDGEDWLYVGDIGDNFVVRPQVVLIGVPEPEPVDGRAQATARVATYQDGPTNAEALVTTAGGTWIFGKTEGPAPVYLLDEATEVFQPTGTTLDVGDDLVTGAGASADGGLLAVRTYGQTLVFPLGPDGDVAAALADDPGCPTADLDEPQGETVAPLADGSGLITISEAPEGQAEVHITLAGG
jgi:hypothetical protein